MQLQASLELSTCSEVALHEVRLILLTGLKEIDAELKRREAVTMATLDWALPKEWRPN